MIGAMRRESSTVVALVGAADEPLLAELARSPNVSLVRPAGPEPASLTAATAALAEAAHRSAPFVLVLADPLAGMAAQWQAMWDLSAGPQGPAGFEEQAAEVLSVWRAKRFELPDYYLVLAAARPASTGQLDAQRRSAGSGGSSPRAGTAPPDLYLGPLRAVRPRRVEVVVEAEGEQEQAARVRQALRSLPHGPWWPPLDELIDTARHFFAGSLAESATQ
jgi:hypothetical protein